MADFGKFTLLLCLFLSGYAVLADTLGSWRKDWGVVKSGRNATMASFACLTVAATVLWMLLVKSDFSVSYVAEHTSKDLPLAYKISAFWAGAAGSLLFWLWLQVGFVTIVFSRSGKDRRVFAAAARAIANFVSVFFLTVMIFDKNPFALSLVTPSDGAGLNPLLQHPAMALHPPTLFIGYAAFAIPFAWSFACLKSRDMQEFSLFLSQARNWILWAWMFLTIGIALGAWWAYEELGWGGYWAWDPVENSSLMPWLVATALLHCSRTYRKNSPIAVWMIILGIVVFSLCILGTFLTRYGLVSSVHAFPDPGLGILFLVLLIHIAVLAAMLLWRFYRRWNTPMVSTGGDNFIVFNNWLMMLLTFVILVGTLFPFLSGLFSDQKITLKPEYFTKITAPIGLAMLFLLAICPAFLRYGINRRWRTIGGLLAAVAVVVFWLTTHKLAILCFILCGFALLSILGDFMNRHLRSRANDTKSVAQKINLRWYGSRIVHIGVVMTFIGIAGSGGFSIEKQMVLKPGDQVNVGEFDIEYKGLRVSDQTNRTAVIADIDVRKGELLVAQLAPSRAFYNVSEKWTSEVDIRRTMGGDLYFALEAANSTDETINLRVLIKPLINWIWIGSIMSVFGVIIILFFIYKQKFTSCKVDMEAGDA
ncbi:MAG: cytochrome c-type biogenesis CcmF C-terminal domain-containing protein [Phycisphaerae bacterium]|nr:cytochrome c-type biogenesis CcmF C-terminal domain-containing protein [Phycisphaerae bacterium]